MRPVKMAPYIGAAVLRQLPHIRNCGQPLLPVPIPISLRPWRREFAGPIHRLPERTLPNATLWRFRPDDVCYPLSLVLNPRVALLGIGSRQPEYLFQVHILRNPNRSTVRSLEVRKIPFGCAE